MVFAMSGNLIKPVGNLCFWNTTFATVCSQASSIRAGIQVLSFSYRLIYFIPFHPFPTLPTPHHPAPRGGGSEQTQSSDIMTGGLVRGTVPFSLPSSSFSPPNSSRPSSVPYIHMKPCSPIEPSSSKAKKKPADDIVVSRLVVLKQWMLHKADAEEVYLPAECNNPANNFELKCAMWKGYAKGAMVS